jgi:hypothetical protein
LREDKRISQRKCPRRKKFTIVGDDMALSTIDYELSPSLSPFSAT